MKVLHVNTEKGWRGGEQQLFYLVKGLKERGIEVWVACKRGEELEKRCKEEGIPTFPLKGNQTSDIFRIGIVGRDFDIVHAHTAKAHTVAAFSKKFHKKPIVYTRRVDFPPKNNPLTLLKYKLTDLTVCVSKEVERIVKERFPNLKTAVIYSVADKSLEKKVNFEVTKNYRNRYKGKKIIGTVAALTSQKNIPNLIEAARIVLKERNDVIFTVFGKGHLEKELKKLVKEKGIENHFVFEGFKKDIQNYIKAFDLFVLPSDYEGFSGALLNAMLLKVPVISTEAGGAREVVENEKTGLLVPKKNPVKLAHAILRLLDDENLKNTLISTAYERVVKNFTVDRMIDAYIEAYGEVVSDRSLVGKVP